MHYKNGREAKAGDRVVLVSSSYTTPVTGILHSLQPSTTTCNGRLALMSPNDPHVTLGDDEDLRARLGRIRDERGRHVVEVQALADRELGAEITRAE